MFHKFSRGQSLVSPSRAGCGGRFIYPLIGRVLDLAWQTQQRRVRTEVSSCCYWQYNGYAGVSGNPDLLKIPMNSQKSAIDSCELASEVDLWMKEIRPNNEFHSGNSRYGKLLHDRNLKRLLEKLEKRMIKFPYWSVFRADQWGYFHAPLKPGLSR